MGIWVFRDAQEEETFYEAFSINNFPDKIRTMKRLARYNLKAFARLLGISLPTLSRLLAGETIPTDDMIARASLLRQLGAEDFSKLAEEDKSSSVEQIVAASTSAVGVAGSLGAVSVAGTVGGLGVPGITSGLAALGGLIGGSMVAGIAVVAAIPVIAGIGGYGIAKGIKALSEQAEIDKRLEATEVNEKWELAKPD